MAQRVEAGIETRAKKALAAWCSARRIEHYYLKLTILGFRGWPDRLILWSGGGIMFVEWKAPNGEFEPLQPYVHQLLKRLGFIIEVHNNVDEFMGSITSRMEATRASSKGHETHRK